MSERRLEIHWQDPLPGAKAAREMSGIELLAAIRDGVLAPPPIANLLGFQLTEIGDGWAVFTCEPGEQHYNPIGVVHGGLACTLLDSAMGCAVHSTLAKGLAYTTLELKVNLLRPVTMKTSLLRCEGRIIHAGKRTATAEGKLVDAAGKIYAHATTTCLIFDAGSG